MKNKKEERYCGNCAWFKHEDTNGWGVCYQDPLNKFCNCEMPVSEHNNCGFVSREKERHFRAVLLQANRYRRDEHVPSIYRMPDPKELGKAIDFACECMRVFSEL